MSLDVRIVDVTPMRAASAYGFGLSPEADAWRAMEAFAGPRGLLNDLEARRLFGFNNPYPTMESPAYGYEMWLEVDIGIEPENGIRIVEFFGGRYAASRCEVKGHPESSVPAGWQALADWCQSHNHRHGPHPALERFLSPPSDLARLVVELYYPLA